MKNVSKWLVVVAVTALCGACNDSGKPAADAQSGDTAVSATGEKLTAEAGTAESPKAVPVYHEVTIPSGTALRLDLASSIASDTSHVEDPVRATVREPLVLKGGTVIPKGAQLSGVVTSVAGSGRVKGRAQIAYRFTSLRIGDEQYDIRTAPVSHLAPATKGEDAKKIGIGAGAGAAIGALLGGGGGAAKGAAIGGAGGTGVVLATKGKEVRLGPGANVTTTLTAPLTVRVKA